MSAAPPDDEGCEDPHMEAIVLCGIQGSGKSTLYVERFFATHVRISRDLLKTPHRETRMLDVCLDTHQPFVVDNVNATPDDRGPYIGAARRAGFRTIAWHVNTPVAEAIARNAARPTRWQVTVQEILGTQHDFVAPSVEEGFDEIWQAWADGKGGFRVERRAVAEPAPEPRFTKRAPAPR